MKCTLQGRVDAHFAGMIAPEDERAMRAHLGTCDDCRTRYRRRLVFAKLDPEALPADVRIARGLGLRKRQRRVMRLALPTAGALLTMAAAILLFVRGPHGQLGDGFTSRGPSDGRPPGIADVGAPPLRVYRVPSKEKGANPIPIFDALHRDDELAFAYENADGKKYLMIFAVNEHGRVYWFYPGWTVPAENPRAIAIDEEPGIHALPDAIAHRFEGSELDVHALFVDEPTSVRQVEEAIARQKDASLSVPGGVDRVQRFRILP